MAAVAQPRLDRATLLKGLFFGLGPAAARYPDLVLYRLDPAKSTAAIDRLVADLEAREPGFLERFASSLHSGNHVEIQHAVQDASRLLTSTAESSITSADGTPLADTGYRGLSLFVDEFYVISPDEPSNLGERGGLTVEQWVDRAARTL